MNPLSIGYSIVPCGLGQLLVAATRRGVCIIRFADEPERLVRDLRAAFPFADVEPEAERLAPWVEALERYLDGYSQRLDLPLDVRASQFQRRVWDALRAIPYGHTRSYSEVARAIGQPTAARAVARACASNPVALVIPCHRVIGRRGDIGGYRWGVERKRNLLAREAGVAGGPRCGSQECASSAAISAGYRPA